MSIRFIIYAIFVATTINGRAMAADASTDSGGRVTKPGKARAAVAAAVATPPAPAVIATPPIPAPPVETPLPTAVRVGQTAVALPGLDVALSKIVLPGSDGSIGGDGYTEYVFVFRNTSTDKELRLADIGLAINGDVRRMSKLPEMEVTNQGSTAEKSAAMTAGAGVIGLASVLLGPIGVLASSVGTSAVAHKFIVDDPMKWADEIRKRKLPLGETGQPAVYPGEEVTGSAFVKQTANERAVRLQLYLKIGDAARMYRLDIEGQPAVTADATVR